MKKYRIFCFLLLLQVIVYLPVMAGKSFPVNQKKMTAKFTDTYQQPKLMLGVMIGNPLGIAVSGGWNIDHYSLRLSSGFTLTGWQGLQGDLSYNVATTGKLRHDASIVGGVFRYEDLAPNGISTESQQGYAGLAYTAIYGGFHFQVGYAYGMGDYTHSVFVFQTGYLFKIF